MKNRNSYFFTALVIAGFFLMALASTPPPSYRAPRKVAPEPCVTHAAVTSSTLLVKINFDAGYNMKDLFAARENFPSLFLEALKSRNSVYRISDGVTPNLIFAVTITNDGYNHYGANVTVNGLGEGYLFNYTLAQEYVTPDRLIDDMAKRANEFITQGWHRGNCK